MIDLQVKIMTGKKYDVENLGHSAVPASRAGGSIMAVQLKKNGADYESLY